MVWFWCRCSRVVRDGVLCSCVVCSCSFSQVWRAKHRVSERAITAQGPLASLGDPTEARSRLVQTSWRRLVAVEGSSELGVKIVCRSFSPMQGRAACISGSCASSFAISRVGAGRGRRGFEMGPCTGGVRRRGRFGMCRSAAERDRRPNLCCLPPWPRRLVRF